MKKIMVIFETRPECIKMAPIIKLLEQKDDFDIIVYNTTQHTTMTNQTLKVFNIKPQ